MSIHNALLFSEGDRVINIEAMEWTLDEFEDQPLIILPGDKGTIIKIDFETHSIEILWDKDTTPKMKKTILFEDIQRIRKSL